MEKTAAERIKELAERLDRKALEIREKWTGSDD